jgi:hypothetical protein
MDKFRTKHPKRASSKARVPDLGENINPLSSEEKHGPVAPHKFKVTDTETNHQKMSVEYESVHTEAYESLPQRQKREREQLKKQRKETEAKLRNAQRSTDRINRYIKSRPKRKV